MTHWLKGQTTVGFRRALGQLATEVRLMRRHRRGRRQARRYELPPDPKVQLGSGTQPKPGWINLDLFAPNADITWDVREPLPFPDGSVAMVYSEHMLEHLAYPTDVKHLLTEVRRILRPNGVFSVVVPHCGDALRAYVSGDEAFFLGHDRLRSYLLKEQPTLMHHVNYWFRSDGLHQYGYDEATLGQVLADAGFAHVRVRAYDPSLDSEKRLHLHSLYMEAVKPAAGGAAVRPELHACA
jgi:predicted SAM-dependent methyltransferase